MICDGFEEFFGGEPSLVFVDEEGEVFCHGP